jgi:hypothetical protein
LESSTFGDDCREETRVGFFGDTPGFLEKIVGGAAIAVSRSQTRKCDEASCRAWGRDERARTEELGGDIIVSELPMAGRQPEPAALIGRRKAHHDPKRMNCFDEAARVEEPVRYGVEPLELLPREGGSRIHLLTRACC